MYTEIADSGVLLTLRYLTFVRRRRSTVNEISERILDAFDQEATVEFAYPTYRIYRLGEAANGQLGSPNLHRPSGPGSDG